jgi:hypothetical protein
MTYDPKNAEFSEVDAGSGKTMDSITPTRKLVVERG